MSDLDQMLSIPSKPTHALHVVDNWDGEGDTAFVFAFERGGEFYSYENGKPVLVYKGDNVLHAWPLS